jgi:transposase
MGWKKLLETSSESINDHFRLRNDYLMAENCILRNQIEGRVQLADSERRELAEIGAKLGKQVLAEIATVAQADTILAWHRKFANQTVNSFASTKSVGRPRVDKEIEDMVVRMARENRSWGYDRIQGSLKHLGYMISDQTVGNILRRHGIPPAPEREKTITWREFVRAHLDVLLATDFFNHEVWSWFGLMIPYFLTLIQIGRYPVHTMSSIFLQHLPGWRTLVENFLNVSAHTQRSINRVKMAAQSQPFLFRLSIRQPSHSQLAPLHQFEGRSRVTGQVVPLPIIQVRPIRDGPIQNLRRLCNGSMQDGYRKAA